MKVLKTATNNIDAVLVSAVLCVNTLRVFLGISETSVLLYLVYLFTIFVLLSKYSRKLFRFIASDKTIKNITLFFLYILLFSFFSLAWSTYDKAPLTFLKFVIVLLITYLCLFMPASKLKAVKVCFISINLVYGLYCCFLPSRVYSLFNEGMNYLNVTLTLGASLTISLVCMLMAFFNGEKLRSLLWTILSVTFFISLTGFIARGAILIPPLAAIIMLPFLGRHHRWKMVLLTLVVIAVSAYVVQIYLDMVGDYGANRMMNTFEDVQDEDRWDLWRKCYNIMIERYWFVFGGGIEAFKSTIFYPHNVFLQILGEFGLIPFLIFLSILISIFRAFVRINKTGLPIQRNSLFFVMSGLLYYLMTFSKSFSFYDSLPLLVYIAFFYPLIKEAKIEESVSTKARMVQQ